MKLAPLTAAIATLAATPAMAQNLRVEMEIPRISTAEYHAPYVAIWLERPDQTAVTNLAVWYDFDSRENGGKNWLSDMRTWWRKIGRETTLPADGLSGATRAPGLTNITLSSSQGPLRGVAPGSYNLVIEAARELGGREVVRVPIQWGGAAHSATARGATEIGAVTVSINP